MEESEQGPSSSSGLGLRLRPKRNVSKSTDDEGHPISSCTADGAAIRRSKSNKRICGNNANNSASSEAPPKSLDEICIGTFFLENVMDLLDTPTLKTCRTVNKNWDESARRVLMKRSFLNIARWKGSSSSDDSRLQQYSSWIVDYGIPENSTLVPDHLRKWGESVTSLYITELPFDLRWNVWIRNVLTTWCPNVVAIRLSFMSGLDERNREPSALLRGEWNEFRQSLESVESQEEFRLKLQTSRGRRNSTFQPISTLPNIQWIRLEGCDGMACHYAFNVIQSCVNLKHLYINVAILGRKILNGSEFEILKYLAVRPEITRKLEAFEWTVKTVGFEWRKYQETHNQLVRFVTANDDILPMQFGSRLKSLHWDVLHVDRDGGRLLPGILEKVAGNLTKLCSGKAVLDASDIFVPLDRDVVFDYDYPQKILSVHFPMMAKLSVIEIGQKTCFSISLNDLVDAAPNLRNLTITDSDPSLVLWSDWIPYNIWTGSGSTVLVPNQHNTLKCLKAGYSFTSSEVMRKTLWKFPNLEELWIDGDFDSFNGELLGQLEKVTCKNLDGLKSLKRLYFNCFGFANVGRMLDHLCNLPWKLESLELYKLISYASRLDYREYFERKEELHKKILASSMGSTCKSLVLWSDGRVACTLYVGDRMEWKSVQQQAQKEFFTFIQTNKIPIEMFQIPV
jgi:hypothetical protein